MPRWAKRVDENQKDIVLDLRDLGHSVVVDHDDILVGSGGLTFWYEIKTEDGRLTDSQIKMLARYGGHYRVVRTLDEIVNDIEMTNKMYLQHG